VLLGLAEDMADHCRALGCEPIVYGSLAVLAHTGNAALVLNDVDFLAPETLFPELAARCRGAALAETTSYHSLKIHRSGASVSFDSLDHYLGDIPRDPVWREFGDARFLVLDRAALIESYRRGAATIPVKRASYLEKLRLLGAAA
jgi:hypothetical protein